MMLVIRGGESGPSSLKTRLPHGRRVAQIVKHKLIHVAAWRADNARIEYSALVPLSCTANRILPGYWEVDKIIRPFLGVYHSPRLIRVPSAWIIRS